MDTTLDNWHPYPILPILFIFIYRAIILRAQFVPTPAALSTAWLTLVNLLLPCPAPCRIACNIINSQSGHIYSHCTPIIQHVIQSSVADPPPPAGARVTIFQTSQFPEIPSTTTDTVEQTAIGVMFVQLGLSILLNKIGFASITVVVVAIIETLVGLLAWELVRHLRNHDLKTIPVIPQDQREVLCMSTGQTTKDAVIVISKGGAAKLEHLVEGHAPPQPSRWGRTHFVVAPVFILALYALSTGFSRLSVMDAWCLLAVWVPGIAHAAYAAQTWRTPSALGFKFKLKKIVQEDTNTRVVEEVERIEPMASHAIRRMLAMENGDG